mmetsp:Transcript_47839/g.95120  ORF Transcript_47839/g.95120 Transcript_47839/m.95120 type:complete len:533 (-) Transcript_47839:292-1890(-)|eukprot:CAMPEP_0172719850 /NCGR_PEP_ID=MMETSP1074-20121228/75743_1 /TAXON_ID=2916 /ORGANISM="Ceratium fusus, Strain PA161109" /LENGTH=532 /DNA_ID=CAMNT_0013545249 /DNA_START=60 /DNA_END=1658 /DNA_ORIENTATION=-
MGLEYAVELIPCYKDGLWHLVKRFGVDRTRETQEAYCEAYLNAGLYNTAACPRKRDAVPDESYVNLRAQVAIDEGPAFINVWSKFVHCSLMFINPPSTMDDAEATQYIKKFIHLEELVNVEHPRLTFIGKVQGRTAGTNLGRTVWQIDSKPSEWVRKFRMQLQEVFTRHGFSCRFPSEKADQVHCTIRDSRYGGQSNMKVPFDQGTLDVVFDKLGVTPAAENDARHDCKRKFCGKTHCLDFFQSRQDENLGSGSSSVSLLDIASSKQFPTLSLAPHAPKKSSNRCYGRVIQPVLHLDPAADIIVPIHNSTEDTVRSLLHEESMSSNEAGDDTASMRIVESLPQEHEACADEKVWLLHFSMQGMKSEEFQAVLSQSEGLQKVQQDMERAGYNWLLQPSEAKMFVFPTQCSLVETTLKNPVYGIVLHPFHVIVTESLEDHLHEALQKISYKSRPRSKPKKRRDVTRLLRLEEPNNLDMLEHFREGQKYASEFNVQRTFLCEVPVLRKRSAVTQSTTEATTALKVINPRRIQCDP